jgi:hypothetical protein
VRERGIKTRIAEAVSASGGAEKISSSAIRNALREGRPEIAASLLGRPFAIEGEVFTGDQRGRCWAFPPQMSLWAIICGRRSAFTQPDPGSPTAAWFQASPIWAAAPPSMATQSGLKCISSTLRVISTARLWKPS